MRPGADLGRGRPPRPEQNAGRAGWSGDAGQLQGGVGRAGDELVVSILPGW